MARDLDGAIGILEEATTGLGPEHQEHARFLYENLGLIYLQTHLVRHAALCFLRALDGDPTSREQSLRLLIVAYARLGQRMSTWMGSQTSAGILFETDLRLRPNGDAGMMVSEIEAFRDYQLTKAWAWEHQALTRARFCAGDAELGARFEAIRIEILRQPRDLEKLKEEVPQYPLVRVVLEYVYQVLEIIKTRKRW